MASIERILIFVAGAATETAETADDPWNSLEVVKLIVAALTPVVVVVLTLYVSRRVQRSTATDAQLIEKRIEVFDLLGHSYNRVFAYILYRGGFREIEPTDIIDAKRKLDRELHIYVWLFERSDLLLLHDEFMRQCFRTYNGPGTTAQIRTEYTRSRVVSFLGAWDPAWDKLFTGEENSDEREAAIESAYVAIMRAMSSEFTRSSSSKPFVSGAAKTVTG